MLQRLTVNLLEGTEYSDSVLQKVWSQRRWKFEYTSFQQKKRIFDSLKVKPFYVCFTASFITSMGQGHVPRLPQPVKKLLAFS